jgi:hypothetical protein
VRYFFVTIKKYTLYQHTHTPFPSNRFTTGLSDKILGTSISMVLLIVYQQACLTGEILHQFITKFIANDFDSTKFAILVKLNDIKPLDNGENIDR